MDPVRVGAQLWGRYGELLYQHFLTAVELHVKHRAVLDAQPADYQIRAHEESNHLKCTVLGGIVRTRRFRYRVIENFRSFEFYLQQGYRIVLGESSRWDPEMSISL